jgi:RNA polymerase sigma-70 factor (ECF subfamily)
MNTSDSILIDHIRQGDRKAFNELFCRYRKNMLAFCTALLKDVDEAENIVQESFIKFWEIRQRLDPGRDAASYLQKIIRNKAFDHLKHLEKNYALQKRLKYHEWPVDLMPAPMEESIFVSLEAMIRPLPPKRRRIISLIIEHGKTHKEVAEEMCISVSTVKNQMVKAKKYLQHTIDPGTWRTGFGA